MPKNRQLLTALLVASSALTAYAGPQRNQPISERARSSQHVVVATVAGVDARYQTNEFGDRLIVSRVVLDVTEAMKGGAAQTLDIDLEGGTVGDVTLAVSDLPKLQHGERAVFFLSKDRAGRLVPHLRGQSILKLDRTQRVSGTDVTLDEVRYQVRGAR